VSPYDHGSLYLDGDRLLIVQRRKRYVDRGRVGSAFKNGEKKRGISQRGKPRNEEKKIRGTRLHRGGGGPSW